MISPEARSPAVDVLSVAGEFFEARPSQDLIDNVIATRTGEMLCYQDAREAERLLALRCAANPADDLAAAGLAEQRAALVTMGWVGRS